MKGVVQSFLNKKETTKMKNIKSETKANVDMMKAELSRLNAKRAEWERGAFKRSNEQLYAVLEECHRLLVNLRADVKLRKKLNTQLKQTVIRYAATPVLSLKLSAQCSASKTIVSKLTHQSC